ncbi:MAG: DUF6067 family protein [Armatimonadota bacterium]|nr:DUF6067 family protein [Armatimonadota bacterium]
MRIAIIVILTAAAVAGFAQDDAAALYASFDGSLDAEAIPGPVEAAVEGSPRFVEGRVGQAVVVSNESWLSYPAEGTLNPAQGAVEFWLQPIDWDGTDEEDSHFFVGAAGRDRMYIYKFARWRHFTFHVNTDDADRYESLRAAIWQWEAGEWHHAVVTWDQAYMRIYLDGEMAAEASIPSPIDDLGGTIFVGRELATPQFAAGETAIDELYIYPRPLFPEEVRRAYLRAENPQITQQPYRALQIYYTGFPSERRAELQFVSSVTVAEGGSATLTVTDSATGRTAIERELDVQPAGTLAGREIDTSGLTPAEYDVLVTIRDAAGDVVLEESKRLWIRDRFWKRDPAGLVTDVPEPWTPVEVEGTTVRTWNREYQFGAGLIETMTTGGEQILSRPAGIYTREGAWVSFERDWRLVESTPLQAVFESELRAGDRTITQRATVEFDGLIRLDVSIPAGARVDLLRFDLPVRGEIAKYARTSSQREKYYVSGELEPGAWPASEVFDFWMGDEDRGVSVVLEGCVGWSTEDDETQLQLVDRGADAMFIAHIAREPTAFEEPLSLSVGIQATPVRPLPQGWRADWRLAPRVGVEPDPQMAEDYAAEYAVIWWSDHPDTPRWFGFPQPSDPEAFRQLVDDFHSRGIKVLVYDNLTSASPNLPETIQYSGEWFRDPTPVALPDPDEEAPPERWQRVRLRHPDWTDFIVGWEARIIDEYGVDGWYFDCAVPYGMDGVHPVFAYREACKRAYVAVKRRKPDGAVITHMSSHYTAPALAFSDAMLQGEQFRWPLPEWKVADDYTQVLSLDYARTELTGRNLGCVPVFLPEFPPGHRTERNSRHLMALTRLHDINVWPIWTDPDPFGELWRAQDDFGIGGRDVHFLPYWEEPAAEVDAEEVMVSAYRRPGRALLVVSNFLGHEDRTVRVTPKLGLLGLEGPVAAEDLLTGQSIPMADGALTLDLAEGRARYVVLTEE